MNKGMIIGRVENAEKATVSLTGIKVGHVGNKLEIYNAKSGAIHNLGLSYTNEDGMFSIPFIWDETNLGDFMNAHPRFRVFAVDQSSSASGAATGKLFVGQNMFSLWDNATKNMTIAGLLELKGFFLASAIMTAFSPALSADHKFAIGIAVIELS